MRNCICLCVAAVANLVAFSPSFAAPITRFVTQSGGTTRSDTFPQAGFGFYIGTTGTVDINRLGYWDEGNDGLGAAHAVGLYHFTGSTHELIAKATIPAGTGSTLENGFRWVSIPTVTLSDNQQGQAYYKVLASHGTDIWYDNGVSVVTPAWGTLITSGFLENAAMGEVGSTAGISVGPVLSYGSPNIGFAVPEPSSLALLVFGAIALVFGRVRRAK